MRIILVDLDITRMSLDFNLEVKSLSDYHFWSKSFKSHIYYTHFSI